MIRKGEVEPLKAILVFLLIIVVLFGFFLLTVFTEFLFGAKDQSLDSIETSQEKIMMLNFLRTEINENVVDKLSLAEEKDTNLDFLLKLSNNYDEDNLEEANKLFLDFNENVYQENNFQFLVVNDFRECGAKYDLGNSIEFCVRSRNKNYEDLENICDDNKDNDNDQLTDCRDNDCDKFICKSSQGVGVCSSGRCVVEQI